MKLDLPKTKTNTGGSRNPILRGPSVFGAAMGMSFSLFQSVWVAVPWWRGELEPGLWAWFWIGLLPVWVFVFIRYFSIFRPDCTACSLHGPANYRHSGP